jgi:hypothetical protein
LAVAAPLLDFRCRAAATSQDEGAFNRQSTYALATPGNWRTDRKRTGRIAVVVPKNRDAKVMVAP